MYLVQAKPKDPSTLIDYAYQDHVFAWRLMCPDGNSKARDFLFCRHRDAGGKPYLVILSAAAPPSIEVEGWDLVVQHHDPKYVAGQKLSFYLRANPTYCSHQRYGHKRSDMVMGLVGKLQRERRGEAVASTEFADIIRDAGLNWLGKKALANGFSFAADEVTVREYHMIKFPHKRNNINLSSLTFEGVLTVEDPEKFLQAEANGIGSAKGFGFGLMLTKAA